MNKQEVIEKLRKMTAGEKPDVEKLIEEAKLVPELAYQMMFSLDTQKKFFASIEFMLDKGMNSIMEKKINAGLSIISSCHLMVTAHNEVYEENVSWNETRRRALGEINRRGLQALQDLRQQLANL